MSDLGKVSDLSSLAAFGNSYVQPGDNVFVVSEQTEYFYALASQGASSVKATLLAGYWFPADGSSVGAWATIPQFASIDETPVYHALGTFVLGTSKTKTIEVVIAGRGDGNDAANTYGGVLTAVLNYNGVGPATVVATQVVPLAGAAISIDVTNSPAYRLKVIATDCQATGWSGIWRETSQGLIP